MFFKRRNSATARIIKRNYNTRQKITRILLQFALRRWNLRFRRRGGET